MSSGALQDNSDFLSNELEGVGSGKGFIRVFEGFPE